jgi:aspartyl-tRNA(Asn)/glutamyl-tRNA(Gln) amidotransferase subunit A
MARTVRDAALLYQAMAGPDPDDPDTWGHACEDVLEELDADIAGMRVCLPRQYFWEDVDPEVDAAVRASAQVFADQGAQVEEIALEELDQLAELRARGSTTPPQVYLRYREHLERDLDQFDPIVSSRMLEGRRMGAVEYLELDQAYARLRQRAVRSLGSVDALLTPTTPCAALPLEQADRDDRYAAINGMCLRNTVVANLWGLCAISLPCGATRSGLPIGLQLVGRPFGEAAILRLAHAYEQSTSWHLRHPRVEAFSRGA